MAHEIERIEIQVMDDGGNWRTHTVLMVNDSSAIQAAYRDLEFQFSGKRMRAVDQNGRVVDIR